MSVTVLPRGEDDAAQRRGNFIRAIKFEKSSISQEIATATVAEATDEAADSGYTAQVRGTAHKH